jgi:hypothetical protein
MRQLAGLPEVTQLVEASREEIRKIQRDAGMPPSQQDGIMGPRTQRALDAQKKNNPGVTSNPVPPATSGRSAPPAAPVLPQQQAPAPRQQAPAPVPPVPPKAGNSFRDELRDLFGIQDPTDPEGRETDARNDAKVRKFQNIPPAIGSLAKGAGSALNDLSDYTGSLVKGAGSALNYLSD